MKRWFVMFCPECKTRLGNYLGKRMYFCGVCKNKFKIRKWTKEMLERESKGLLLPGGRK